jgi:D-glycero-D-manno-heptose 1,7-bisphosphate phosphatase
VSLPRLVLLDRDGTINAKAPDGEYVEAPEALELLPGAAAAVARLNRAKVPVAVVTNQRGVALGRMSIDDLNRVHAAMAAGLAAQGAHVDGLYVCPHATGTCTCRKPEPDMLLDALRDFGVAAEDAVMIGDSDSDVEAGIRAGTATIRLDPGGETPDLAAFVDRLLGPGRS